MIHYKTVHVPAETRKVEDHRTCDWCSEVIREEGRFDCGEVNVYGRRGQSYGDSGDSVTTNFDFCYSCFYTRLVPYLESQGVKPAVTERDW